jgi:hypothetical protein
MGDNALKTPLNSSLINSADRRSNNFRQSATKAMPCHVTKIDKDFATVSFDPQNGIWTLPQIKIPVSMSRYVRDPTQVGDYGYAVPSDYNTNTLTGLGGSFTNFFPKGNLSPLSFQPFSRTQNEDRDYDQLTLTGGPHGVKIIQSPQKNKQPPPQGSQLSLSQRRMRPMGARARASWLKARDPVPVLEGELLDPAVTASLIPMTTINIDQLGNMAVSAIKGITHIADNVMPLTSLPTSLRGIVNIAGGGIAHLADNIMGGVMPPGLMSLQGIVHMAEGGIAHIADGALGAVLPPQAQGILHLAEQAITHTSLLGTITHSSLAGAINLVVQNGLKIGAPSGAYQYSSTTPPLPTLPTIVTLLGSLNATAGITAASISAPNISVGGYPVMTNPVPPQLVNAPQSVTGSRGGNVALQSLLNACVTLGLIVNNTSP